MNVILRPYRDADRDVYRSTFGDAEVMRFVGGAMTAERADALFDSLRDGTHERALAAFAAVDGDEAGDALIGHAVLFRWSTTDAVEIGFILPRRNWGRGAGTAIASALVEEARARGFSRAVGTVDLDNSASQRILEKLGGERRRERDDDGEYWLYEIMLSVALPDESAPR